MKKHHSPLALLTLLLAAAALVAPVPACHDTLLQFSTIDALLAGLYDGVFTLREVKAGGDFGIGTFDHLEGEMVLLDGVVHQVKADGTVARPPDTMTIPFATVSSYSAESTFELPPGATYASAQDALLGMMPSENVFCAFRIEGVFSYMKTRSVPRQEPPYRPLAEVVKDQAEFEFKDVRGTLMGYYAPPFSKGVNVPGFHFHFLTEDKTAGGHVLDCVFGATRGGYDVMHEFEMRLPDAGPFLDLDLTPDRSDELDVVEKPKE